MWETPRMFPLSLGQRGSPERFVSVKILQAEMKHLFDSSTTARDQSWTDKVYSDRSGVTGDAQERVDLCCVPIVN